MNCLIPLTQGQVVRVSPRCFDEMAAFNWYAHWCPHTKSYYAGRNVPLPNGQQYTLWMHRAILGLARGDKRQGDHWNHDTLDNTDVNLRVATHAEQVRNRGKQRSSKTGAKGVTQRKGTQSYRVRITVDGREILVGQTKSFEAAKQMYAEACGRLHGRFGRTE